MNRRRFLRLCGKLLTALGLAHLFPAHKAAAAAAIRAPRQIVTEDIARARTIMWDAPSLPARALVEVRHGDSVRQIHAAYEWLSLSGEALYHYAASVTGLTPGAAHSYRIVMDEETTDWLPLAGADRSGKDASFEALIYADSQCTDFSILQAFLQTTMARHPNAAFFAALGDLVDNGELASYWARFLSAISPYASRLPFVPVMGNHECYGADWKNALPRGYLAAFCVPENGSARFSRYYYSFDWAPFTSSC